MSRISLALLVVAVAGRVAAAQPERVASSEHWVEKDGIKIYLWEKYAGSPSGKSIVVLAHMVSAAFPGADPRALSDERRALRAARSVIVTSDWTRSELIRLHLVPAERIVVATPGAEGATVSVRADQAISTSRSGFRSVSPAASSVVRSPRGRTGIARRSTPCRTSSRTSGPKNVSFFP